MRARSTLRAALLLGVLLLSGCAYSEPVLLDSIGQPDPMVRRAAPPVQRSMPVPPPAEREASAASTI
ncbi:MAG: hypothetical protein AMXMBFR7_29420 [Planctomycetota bacterium]